MKAIRLAALLLLALTAACTRSATGPSTGAENEGASFSGQGLMGGGTRSEP